MLKDEILLENGYRKSEDVYRHAECLFQKRIRDKKGNTMYFINIYKYIFPVKNYVPIYEVELNTETNKYALNVTLYNTKEMTLEDIEREIHNIWENLGCKYYEIEVE